MSHEHEVVGQALLALDELKRTNTPPRLQRVLRQAVAQLQAQETLLAEVEGWALNGVVAWSLVSKASMAELADRAWLVRHPGLTLQDRDNQSGLPF